MCVCIISILAQIKIDLPSLVPITLQTLGIYLASCILKPKLAFCVSLVYVLAGAIGLPVFSGFGGGLSSLLGLTGGYIFSFPIMALVISLIVNKRSSNILKIIAMLIGTGICYLIGTIWFIYLTKNTLFPSLMMCVIPFIPGDIVKIIIATLLSNKIKL